MSEYQPEEIKNKITQLGTEQPWHHNIELPYGIVTCPDRKETSAKNILKWARLEPVFQKMDLSNSRVLDIGCSEGYYSFEISRMGAKEVIALDLNELRLKKAEFVKEVKGIDNVTFKNINVVDISNSAMGHFDLVMCFGFLHRFPDIFALLKKLTSMSDTIALEWKVPLEYQIDQPIMTFATNHFKGCDQYNISHWYPTANCVIAVLERFGFTHHYPIQDGRDKRVALISSRNSIVGENEKCNARTRSIFHLLFKYTRYYLKTLCKIASGKIRS